MQNEAPLDCRRLRQSRLQRCLRQRFKHHFQKSDMRQKARLIYQSKMPEKVFCLELVYQKQENLQFLGMALPRPMNFKPAEHLRQLVISTKMSWLMSGRH